MPPRRQRILKNFSGVDVTRSKRRGRQPKPPKQESTGGIHQADALAESTSAIRNQGDAPAGSVSGVCSQDNAPSEPAQQYKSGSGEQSPVSIQPAHAKANLQFVSLCCPTLLLESTAFLWKLVEFILGFREPTPVEMSLPGFSGHGCLFVS